MFGLSLEGPVDESFIHSYIPTHLVGNVVQTCVGMKRMAGRKRKERKGQGRPRVAFIRWDLGAAAGGDCCCRERSGLRVTHERPLSFHRRWQTTGQPAGRGSSRLPGLPGDWQNPGLPTPDSLPFHCRQGVCNLGPGL